MNEQQLLEIEARCNAATPGKWQVYENDEGGLEIIDGKTRRSWESINAYDVDEQVEANAEFIAESRTDIPALIAALREAWEKIEAMRDGMDQCK